MTKYEKPEAEYNDLPDRIKYLIETGVVKVMTWEKYQQWKRSKLVVEQTDEDDPDNTYYGLSSWLDDNGVLKPEYVLPEFNEKTKIYILKG
jgi:hypothetical protein